MLIALTGALWIQRHEGSGDSPPRSAAAFTLQRCTWAVVALHAPSYLQLFGRKPNPHRSRQFPVSTAQENKDVVIRAPGSSTRGLDVHWPLGQWAQALLLGQLVHRLPEWLVFALFPRQMLSVPPIGTWSAASCTAEQSAEMMTHANVGG